jgi:hypothetical protein
MWFFFFNCESILKEAGNGKLAGGPEGHTTLLI